MMSFHVFVLCLEHTSSWYVTDIVWFGFMVSVHLNKSLTTLINSWQSSGRLAISIRSVVWLGFSRRSGGCIIHAVSKMVVLVTRFLRVTRSILKMHNLIFLSNKIRLNMLTLINTFVMSRNKHISKKTPCFSRKRSKNKAKPNEFERRILKLSCYACSDNPKCRHAFSMFRNASSQNEFRFNLTRCMTESETFPATPQK